ncbi:hypothetical protein ACFQZ8_02330 [Micromonospora azadirachtae]|uniref:Uncharacterized protein n=1 Tax=Micromonospora azadirachtae TaxID=1970735 RepID=A0ABW2ZVU0_9ACTN
MSSLESDRAIARAVSEAVKAERRKAKKVGGRRSDKANGKEAGQLSRGG